MRFVFTPIVLFLLIYFIQEDLQLVILAVLFFAFNMIGQFTKGITLNAFIHHTDLHTKYIGVKDPFDRINNLKLIEEKERLKVEYKNTKSVFLKRGKRTLYFPLKRKEEVTKILQEYPKEYYYE